MKRLSASEFLSINSIDQLQSLSPVIYPSFAAVTAALNKATYPVSSLINLFPGRTLGEKIHCALNNLSFIPTCHCGTQLKFYSIKGQGYRLFCSDSCREKCPTTQQRREQTNLARFGVINAGMNEYIKKKIKTTVISRHGVESVLSLLEVIKKSRETKKHIQPETTKKTQATCLAKYWHVSWLHTAKGKDTVKQTMIKRYGYPHSSQIPAVKEVKKLQLYKFRRGSKFEDEVFDAIVSLGYEGVIHRNYRSLITPYEVDLWLPELNLAIECNGCYWHSDHLSLRTTIR